MPHPNRKGLHLMNQHKQRHHSILYGSALTVAALLTFAAPVSAANFPGGSQNFPPVHQVDPPDTMIESGPEGTISSRSAQFAFSSSSQPGSTFRCDLHKLPAAGAPATPREPFQSCESGVTYPNLDDGDYTFSVFALHPQGGPDQTPAERNFTVAVDDTPPDTTISGAPRTKTREGVATFTFESSEPGSSFECKFDAGSFEGCVSPYTTPRLKHGRHSFQVRATDAAGNVDPSPAEHRFKRCLLQLGPLCI